MKPHEDVSFESRILQVLWILFWTTAGLVAAIVILWFAAIWLLRRSSAHLFAPMMQLSLACLKFSIHSIAAMSLK